MTQPEALVDAWLDNEIDAAELARLETWLREDPAHLRAFVQAVSLQESLRTSPDALRRSRRRRIWRISLGSVAALLAVIVLFRLVFSTQYNQVAVVDPTENPDPKRNPGPVPRPNPTPKKLPDGLTIISGDVDVDSSDMPDATVASTMGVSAGEKSGALRWKKSIELHLESHAKIELNPQHPFATPPDVSCVALNAGKVRISRTRNPFAFKDSVEVETPLATVVGSNADFTVAITDDKKVVVSVTSGSVKILRQGKEQIVKAGETVTLSE